MNRPFKDLARWLLYAAFLVISCEDLSSCIQAGTPREEDFDDAGKFR